MSHPSRPQARGPAPRPRRQHRIEPIQALEDRLVMAPVVSSTFRTAVFTPFPKPTNDALGFVTITQAPLTNAPSPVTSVSEFATNSQFGGDIVKIKAGPGGEFGKGLYAISRGAGSNTNAINKPGVIYRLDPATGRSSLFFDLNTVISQLEPGATAAASVGASTGLVNWYDLAFDNEGYFDGKPSLFVSTADRSDPNKNLVYRIAPDGTFMGAFVKFSSGQSSLKFNVNPTSILVPPPEQQTFLRGLFVGNGTPNAPTTDASGAVIPTFPTSSNFTALFFDANAFRPGQNIAGSTLPPGASVTPLNFGPQVALTAANVNYISPAYSAFTDFGTPGPPYDTNTGGIQGAPGLSGVQGVGGASTIGSFTSNSLTPASSGAPSGELLITNTTTTAGAAGGTNSLFQIFDVNGGLTPAEVTALTKQATATAPSGVDTASAVSTPFRRFQDIAFDQYGYFSSNAPLAGFGAPAAGGGAATATSGDKLPYAGSVFVSDLATGLAVGVTSVVIPAVPAVPGVSPAIPAVPATPVAIPIQGQGPVGVQLLDDGTFGPIVTNGNTTDGSNVGGRIIRIDPNGKVSEFATNFNTSRFQNSQSFIDSSLSITFSADGTTLYAADNDGIWQFKTVTSLAGSTAGSIVGLNDLRTLGVPYDGQNSAVAVVDTGVDQNPSFRGRVAVGQSILFNGAGNQDTAPGVTTTTSTGTTSSSGSFPDGHGTLLAGVVAQFVPQATLEPVNVFSPVASTAATATGGGAANAVPGSQATTSPQALYQGLQYTADHPFVADPVRRNKQDRVVGATLGFGTTATFGNEVEAFRKFPQVTLALKNQLHRLRDVGITTIAAAGQFGGTTSAATNGGGGGGGAAAAPTQNGLGDVNGMSLPAVFNEVISVTGTYPFPIQPNANSTPLNNYVGLLGRFPVPYLLGGISTTAASGGAAATTGTIGALVSQDSTIFKDKLLSSVNRNVTTDFAAPALDIPTFGRLVAATTTTTNGGATANVTSGLVNNPADLVFQQGGTSLSAAITSGSFALVASALNYFAALTPTGATTDAYLTQPVGARSLNFGPHVLKDLNAYANPDGINSILQWTSVPVADDPATFADGNTGTTSNGGGGGGAAATTRRPGGARLSIRTLQNRSYSRISVGNAIAAIEGTVALDYLFKHNTFDVIDTNHNGLVTAQEIQNFVDAAPSMGLPEAGAMARLLGGNARSPGSGTTGAGQTPDQPDVLQRRFNFFDFAANGSLKGVISIDALRQLSQKLLPQPGDFSIVDRTRSSAIRYLLSPSTVRATQDLQYIAPGAEFIPARTVARYKGISPLKFGVGRNANPLTSGPAISLFDVPTTSTRAHAQARAATETPKVATPTASPTPSQATPTTHAATTPTASTPLVAVPGVATASNPTGRPVANQTTPTAQAPAAVPAAPTPTATSTTASTGGVTYAANDRPGTTSIASPNTGTSALATPKPAGNVNPTPAAPTTASTSKTTTAAHAYAAIRPPVAAANAPAKSINSVEKFVRSLGIPFLKKV